MLLLSLTRSPFVSSPYHAHPPNQAEISTWRDLEVTMVYKPNHETALSRIQALTASSK